jgi:hypothetical protein
MLSAAVSMLSMQTRDRAEVVVESDLEDGRVIVLVIAAAKSGARFQPIGRRVIVSPHSGM